LKEREDKDRKIERERRGRERLKERRDERSGLKRNHRNAENG
jgi:hypothetical protein